MVQALCDGCPNGSIQRRLIAHNALEAVVAVAEIFERLQTDAMLALWSLLVGNQQAKVHAQEHGIVHRVASLFVKRSRTVQHQSMGSSPACNDVAVQAHTAMVLWSACYEVDDARRACLNTPGCLKALVCLLQLEEAQLNGGTDDDAECIDTAERQVEAVLSARHAAAGALWHIGANSDCAHELARLNVAHALALVMKRAESYTQQHQQQQQQGQQDNPEADATLPSRLMELDERAKRMMEMQAFCALAAGTLSLHGDEVFRQLQSSGTLQCLMRLATSLMLGKQQLHVSLCFTGGARGVRPVTQLLESEMYSVQAIGCALIGHAVRKDALPGFHEAGVVNIIRNDLAHDNEAVRACANMALSALGAPLLTSRSAECESDLLPWLRREGLGKTEASVLQSLEITSLETLEKLSDADVDALPLRLGVRRHLQNALKRLQEGRSHMSCVICFQKQREAAFVACGHVVACMDCALLLHARSDSCPVCRRPLHCAESRTVDLLKLHYA